MTRDEDSGRYQEEFSNGDFLTVIDGEEMTTQQVADDVGCAYRTAHARLTALETRGEVHRREVGNSLVWSLADDE